MNGIPSPSDSPKGTPSAVDANTAELDKSLNSEALHPRLGKVSRADESVKPASLKKSSESDQKQPLRKSILKRQVRKHSVSQPVVNSHAPDSKSKKAVSFDEKPRQVMEHIRRDSSKLQNEIRATALLKDGNDEELLDMLSTQYIIDLTTRPNPKKRLETFDSLKDAVRERIPEAQHDRLDKLADQAEASANKLLNSTYQVTTRETPEKLEKAIESTQEKLNNLLTEKAVDQPAVEELKALLDEFRVALEVLNKQVGRKSLSKFPDKGLSPTSAPKLWILRHLLSENLTLEANHFIKSQRVPKTIEAMMGILEFGSYDQPELLETARQRLEKLRSQPGFSR